MKKTNKILSIALPICAILIVMVLWYITALNVDDSTVLPTIKETFSEFITLFNNGSFYTSLLNTFIKSLISFIISFLIAQIFGIIAKRNELFRKFISPIIAIMRALPTVAVVLLLLVWTDSLVAPIVVTILVVLPTIYTTILGNLNQIDNRQIEMCKLFNVKESDIAIKVLIPQIMPSMLNTIGSAISLNIKLMVAAEVLAMTGNSIGNMLNQANLISETPRLLALVVVVVIVGLIIEGVFSLLSKKAGEKL